MKNKTAAAVLAASVLAGSGAALAAPGLAFAAGSSSSTGTGTGTSPTDRVADRLTAIKDALKGLVSAGTISQAQADRVATTLAQSHIPFGHRGGHRPGDFLRPDIIAKALGISVDALHTAHENGQTLTQIAAAKGISRADLISRLVAAAKAEMAADLSAGRLTQARYDTLVSTLTARIGARVDRADERGPDGPPPAGTSSAVPSSTA